MDDDCSPSKRRRMAEFEELLGDVFGSVSDNADGTELVDKINEICTDFSSLR